MQTLPLFLIAHGILSGYAGHAAAYSSGLHGSLWKLYNEPTPKHTVSRVSRHSRPFFKRFSTTGDDQDNENEFWSNGNRVNGNNSSSNNNRVGSGSSEGTQYQDDREVSVHFSNQNSQTRSFKNANTRTNNRGAQSKSNPSSKSPRQRSVWVVDDEESLRLAIGTYLKEYGFSIRVFHSALAALDALELPLPDEGEGGNNNNNNNPQDSAAASTNLPDVILSDIMMPDMSGIEFCTYLRSIPQTRSIPLILLTAKGQTADRIDGYNAGADSYISKPFDAEELVTIIEGCIARRDFLRGDEMKRIGDGTVAGLNEKIPDNISLAVNDLKRDLEEIKSLILENDSNVDSMRRQLPSNENGMATQDNNSKGYDSSLTAQEMQVLELLCEGYMNKEIAAELQYSTTWVEKHLTVMYRKTGCANRTELVRWAVANDYVEF